MLANEFDLSDVRVNNFLRFMLILVSLNARIRKCRVPFHRVIIASIDDLK